MFNELYQKCKENLLIPPKNRTLSNVKQIIPYINTLKSFIYTFKSENESKFPEMLNQLCQNMIYQNIVKDRFVVKFGERGNVFYVILKGKIAIVIVKYQKIELNEEEYILQLLKYKRFKENELIRLSIALNNNTFHIDENFEKFMKNTLKTENENTYSPELYKKIKETLKFIKLKVDPFPEGVNPQKYSDYINYKPYLFENEDSVKNKNKKLVSLPYYEFVNVFSTGQTFGYFALENANSKRTATIITLEDCEFGVITKQDYDKLLKQVNERIRKKFYSIIFSLSPFMKIPKKFFENYYYNFFDYHLIERKHVLIQQNEINDNVYVLRNGEYSMSFYGNIIDLNNVIISLKKYVDNVIFKFENEDENNNNNENNNNINENNNNDKKYFEEEENDEFILMKSYKSKEFNEKIYEKKNINICLIKDRDLIGLNDMINYENKKSFFTVVSETNENEIYMIQLKLLKRLRIEKEIKLFEKEKIIYIIERLQNYKQNLLNKLEKKDFEERKKRNLIYENFLNKNKKNNVNNLSNINNNESLIKIINENKINNNNNNIIESKPYYITEDTQKKRFSNLLYSLQGKNYIINNNNNEKKNKIDIKAIKNIFNIKGKFKNVSSEHANYHLIDEDKEDDNDNFKNKYKLPFVSIGNNFTQKHLNNILNESLYTNVFHKYIDINNQIKKRNFFGKKNVYFNNNNNNKINVFNTENNFRNIFIKNNMNETNSYTNINNNYNNENESDFKLKSKYNKTNTTNLLSNLKSKTIFNNNYNNSKYKIKTSTNLTKFNKPFKTTINNNNNYQKKEIGIFDPLIMEKFNKCYRMAINNLSKEIKK